MSRTATGQPTLDEEGAAIAEILNRTEFTNLGAPSGLLTVLGDHQSDDGKELHGPESAESGSDHGTRAGTVRWMSVSENDSKSAESKLSTFSMALARCVQILHGMHLFLLLK
jgi:hypothetical protein